MHQPRICTSSYTACSCWWTWRRATTDYMMQPIKTQLYAPKVQGMRAITCHFMGFCLIYYKSVMHIYIIWYSLTISRMQECVCFPEYLNNHKCVIDFIQQVNKLHFRHSIVWFAPFKQWKYFQTKPWESYSVLFSSSTIMASNGLWGVFYLLKLMCN